MQYKHCYYCKWKIHVKLTFKEIIRSSILQFQVKYLEILSHFGIVSLEYKRNGTKLLLSEKESLSLTNCQTEEELGFPEISGFKKDY